MPPPSPAFIDRAGLRRRIRRRAEQQRRRCLQRIRRRFRRVCGQGARQ